MVKFSMNKNQQMSFFYLIYLDLFRGFKRIKLQVNTEVHIMQNTIILVGGPGEG